MPSRRSDSNSAAGSKPTAAARDAAAVRQPPSANGRSSLSSRSSRADFFRALVRGFLAAFEATAKDFSAARPERSEIVHRLRVILRRFRTLLRFEQDLFSRREYRVIRAEVDWLFGELGAARNLDILLDEAQEVTDLPLPSEVRARLASERDTAYAAVESSLASQRYRAALDDLRAFVEDGPWTRRSGHTAERREAAARDSADKALARAWKAIGKSKRPSRLSPESRHTLRIRAKRLRYAADLYGILYPGKKAEKRRGKLAVAATALQDVLGTLNDRSVMQQLLAARFPDREWPLADDGELLTAADTAHRKLRQRKPFWE